MKIMIYCAILIMYLVIREFIHVSHTCMKKIVASLALLATALIPVTYADVAQADAGQLSVSLSQSSSAHTALLNTSDVTIGSYNLSTATENVSLKKIIVQLDGTFAPYVQEVRLKGAGNEVVSSAYPVNNYVTFTINNSITAYTNSVTPLTFSIDTYSPDVQYQQKNTYITMTVRSVEGYGVTSGNKITGTKTSSLTSNPTRIYTSELQVNKLPNVQPILTNGTNTPLRFSLQANGASDVLVKNITISAVSTASINENNSSLQEKLGPYFEGTFQSLTTSTTGITSVTYTFSSPIVIPPGTAKEFLFTLNIYDVEFDDYLTTSITGIKAVNEKSGDYVPVFGTLPSTTLVH